MQRILIIDDEAAICQVLGAFLKRLGHSTDEAATLKTARDILMVKSDYDLVITDMVLTDGSSLDLIKQIKETMPKTKVIAITGDSQQAEDSILVQAEKAGADLTVTKPFSLSDIKQKVEELCGV